MSSGRQATGGPLSFQRLRVLIKNLSARAGKSRYTRAQILIYQWPRACAGDQPGSAS
jgi:hypothetical protein